MSDPEEDSWAAANDSQKGKKQLFVPPGMTKEDAEWLYNDGKGRCFDFDDDDLDEPLGERQCNLDDENCESCQ